ncbi:hypothetical protein IQ06DRAFT_350388 [Phaeosphaeriaceae sp. SRC1lsM3a]|nr:hypothetical protein IQ06DRAFT_350388 [Stagonospora sp. SRC1lsM3a]
MRGIPGLYNAAIDMLHEKVAARWVSPNLVVGSTYRRMTSGAALRKYLVDACTLTKDWETFRQTFQDDVANHVAEFLLDAMTNFAAGDLRQQCDRTAWTKLDRCQWHDHSGPGGKLRDELKK